MSLSKTVRLTVDGYSVKLSNKLNFYQGDTLMLKCQLNELGFDIENNVTAKTVIPINPLKASLLVETPQGIDHLEAVEIKSNIVEFMLTKKYTKNIGNTKIQIMLYDHDGCQVTLPEFLFEIKENISEGLIEVKGVILSDGACLLETENSENIVVNYEVHAIDGTPAKQIKDFELKDDVSGHEDILIQDNGITKRLKTAIFQEQIDQTNAQLSGKVHKGEVGVISNAMLSQEVKEAMTGGSVAVVGKDAVLTENIADGQVTGEKTDFLDAHRLNLFNGKFLNGYVSGNANSAKYTTKEVGKTIALNIEPNTDYSVIKSHTEAESGNFFLKVVTSTKTVDEVIGTMVNGYSEILDGEVQILGTSTTTPLLKRNFTTGANDKSVFITVARELIPSYVEVLKGTYSDFQYMTYEPLYIPKSHVDVYRKQEVCDLLQDLIKNGNIQSLASDSVKAQHIVDSEVTRYKLHDYEQNVEDFEPIPMSEIEVLDNCYYATGTGALVDHEQYLVWNFKAVNEDTFIRLNNIFRAHLLQGENNLTFVSLIGGSDNAGLQEFILPKGMTLGITLVKSNAHLASLNYAPNYTLKGLTIESTKVRGKFGVDNVDFIDSQYPSLFNGDFVDFYLTGNPEQNYTFKKTSGYKTLILDIEPNTTYTVLKEPTDVDGGYYYFKLATMTLDRNSLLQCTSYDVDGSVAYSKTSSDLTRYSFTTGENDKAVVVVVAKNLSPYVEVHKGEVNSFVSNSYEPIKNLVGLNVYNKNEVDAIVQSLNQNSTPSNTFIKTSSRCEILLQNTVGYTLEHKVSSGINLDTWMLTKGTANGITLWSGSDIEAPIKEVGTNDFIGGVHGDERFESVQIICDGVLLDLDSDYNLNFNNLTVFVKSTLFRCDTDVPVFTRYKKLEFIDNELIISNRLICLVDNFLVNRHTGCGLYSVYKDLLVGYTVNTKPELITSEATNNDAKLDCGSFYGNGFTVTLKTLSGKTDYYKGSVADFASESRPRYKLYFDCINSSNGVQLNTNDELNTSFSINIA